MRQSLLEMLPLFIADMQTVIPFAISLSVQQLLLPVGSTVGLLKLAGFALSVRNSYIKHKMDKLVYAGAFLLSCFTGPKAAGSMNLA